MAPKAAKKDALDLSAVEKVLQRWSDAKKKEAEASKEIEACKTQIEATMLKTGMEVIKTTGFEVSKRTQSRESVSKADLPSDIFAKYAKKSTFVVLSLKEAKGSNAKAKAKPKAKAGGVIKKSKKN
eukprot:TRINITY_DN57072_c0_g1_i1.p2 TRINITY_DN57072_c0_g1~~TRINITY_DN57072_c0_g1_i1.p2  ORF type:complete len:126 (-),score=36.86 TRINITY_DN57072_c0_g1_i1:212-589(-)